MDGAVETAALEPVVIPNLVALISDACTAIDAYADAARGKCRAALTNDDGRPDRAALEREQHIAHGLLNILPMVHVRTVKNTKWPASVVQT